MLEPSDPPASDTTPGDDAFPQVLAAARAGGPWAWREIYRATAPTLARYLRARGVPDVDDVVGDTFVRVVRSIDRFEGDRAAFRTWTFAIARNLVVDRARQQTRHPLTLVRDDDLAPLAPIGDAEAEAMATLGTEAVRAALGVLSTDQRDVLLLRILGDLTIAEVAVVMGRREGAVKMLQARGLAALRRKIASKAVTL